MTCNLANEKGILVHLLQSNYSNQYDPEIGLVLGIGNEPQNALHVFFSGMTHTHMHIINIIDLVPFHIDYLPTVEEKLNHLCAVQKRCIAQMIKVSPVRKGEKWQPPTATRSEKDNNFVFQKGHPLSAIN